MPRNQNVRRVASASARSFTSDQRVLAPSNTGSRSCLAIFLCTPCFVTRRLAALPPSIYRTNRFNAVSRIRPFLISPKSSFPPFSHSFLPRFMCPPTSITATLPFAQSELRLLLSPVRPLRHEPRPVPSRSFSTANRRRLLPSHMRCYQQYSFPPEVTSAPGFACFWPLPPMPSCSPLVYYHTPQLFPTCSVAFIPHGGLYRSFAPANILSPSTRHP